MRIRLLQCHGSWAMVCSLLTMGLVASSVLAGSPVQAEPRSPQAAVVDIAVVPSSLTVQAGGIFALDIWVYPNGQSVDAVDADMTFDPNKLEVLSVTGDLAALPIELYSAFDNVNGTLTHSRGILEGASPSSDFRLCSIELKAKSPTDETILTFTGLTDAYFEGKSLLDTSSGGAVTVTGWRIFLPRVLKSAAAVGK